MRVRKRSPKPTDGTADLPFSKQRAWMELVPREKWSPLRLKMWRAQQRVAERLRVQSRLIRLNIRRSAGWSPSPRVVAWALKAQSLRDRFEPASLNPARDVAGGEDTQSFLYRTNPDHWPEAIMRQRESPSPPIKSMLLRRAVQVAREYVESVIGIPQRLWSWGSGNLCYLCSGTHSSLDCLSLMEREMEREASHQRMVEERLRVAAFDHDFSDDVMRLGAIHVRVDRISRSRARGLAYLAWQFAKHGLKATPLAPVRVIWSSVQFGSDLWYVLTGQRYLLPRFRDLFDQLWESEVLLDWVEREMVYRDRLRAIKRKPPPIPNERPRVRLASIPELITRHGDVVMLRVPIGDDINLLTALVGRATSIASSLDSALNRDPKSPCYHGRTCNGYMWPDDDGLGVWECLFGVWDTEGIEHSIRSDNVKTLRNTVNTITILLRAFGVRFTAIHAEYWPWRGSLRTTESYFSYDEDWIENQGIEEWRDRVNPRRLKYTVTITEE